MMRKRFAVCLFIVTIATLAPGRTSAQAPAQVPAPRGQGGGPGGGGRGAAAPALIDLTTAKKMVDAAEAAAEAASAKVAIAVVDANGDLVYFRRMDGATAQAVTSAQGKARAAILFGMATKDVADSIAAGKPVSTTITPAGAGAFAVTVAQGGLPVMKAGKLIAGIGAGGSAPAMDEAFARAGADTVK
jgi:glc operon protein GlcG